MRGLRAGMVDEFAHVAVAVVCGKVARVGCGVNRGKQATDAAGALEGAGEVGAPEEDFGEAGAGVFGDAVPAVVEVAGGGGALGAGDEPGEGPAAPRPTRATPWPPPSAASCAGSPAKACWTMRPASCPRCRPPLRPIIP